MAPRIVKSEEAWRAELSPEAFRVTRRAGTEAPWSHPGFPAGPGHFECVCCGAPLFTADTRFESHCGWPSFSAAGGGIDEREDRSHGMLRTEVRCSGCDAHLGHVFPDGPPPTGLRYCINGVALRFVPDPAPAA